MKLTAFILALAGSITSSAYAQDATWPLDRRMTAEQAARLEVREFELTTAPVVNMRVLAKMNRIAGLSASDALGHTPQGESDFALAASLFVAANAGALDLDKTLERLVLRQVRTFDHAVVATFDQQVRFGGEWVPVFDGQVGVVFALDGQLEQIRNFTFEVSGLAQERKLDADRAQASVFERLHSIASSVLVPGQGPNDGAPEVMETLEEFTVESATVEAFGAYGREGAPLVPAYRLHVERECASGACESLTVFVSALDGRSLATRPNAMHSNPPPCTTCTANGMVEVWDPNPVQAPNMIVVPGWRFDSTGQTTYGMYAHVDDGSGWGPTSSTLQFVGYQIAPFPQNIYFPSIVTAYHLVYSSKLLVNEVGGRTLANFPVRVDALYPSSSSYTNNSSPSMNFDSGADDARDGDVVTHEYMHALNDQVDQNFWTAYANIYGASRAEGLADILAGLRMNDPLLMEQHAVGLGWPYTRTVNSSRNMSSWSLNYGDRYTNGTILAAALWDLSLKIGKARTLSTVMQAFSYVSPMDDYFTYLNTAFVPALHVLYPTDAPALEPIVRRAFAEHGIYSPGQTPFTSSDFGTVPYADGVDITRDYVVPGATSLKVTFGAWTTVYRHPTSGAHDDIFVMDAGGVDIPGSPFTGRELQNKTVSVPGDTVKVRLRSNPGDLLANTGPINGPGNWINVVATDPNNQLPVIHAAIMPTSGMDPMRILVDLRNCTDPDGSVIAYTVNFGDGSWDHNLDADYPVVEHIYNRDHVGPIVQPVDFDLTIAITDDKGGVRKSVTPIHVEPYNDLAAPVDFCPAGITSSGCVPSLSATRNPDVSNQTNCVIAVDQLEARQPCLIFYGTGGASPSLWPSSGAGVSCVGSPIQIAIAGNSHGTPGQCDGSLTLDWSAWQAAHPNALGQPWSTGAKVYVQAWCRDPSGAGKRAFSNALELTYLP